MLAHEELKATRLELGLSVEQIAEEMQTSKQMIWKIESGQSVHQLAIPFYKRVLNDYKKRLLEDSQEGCTYENI